MSSGRSTPSTSTSTSIQHRLSPTLSTTTNPINLTSVKVVVRIRPPTSSGDALVPTRFQRSVVSALNPTTIQIESNAATTNSSRFTFDRVISPTEGQDRVYDEAEDLVDLYLSGYNATILAYGQTASGKSYTMGTSSDDEAGIIPRAVASIFQRIEAQEKLGTSTFSIKLSYIEIYNEDLIDLLGHGDADSRPLVQIREDKLGNIIWTGLREVVVSTVADVMRLLSEGSRVRQTNSTEMNSQSSRSHAIFSLTLTHKRSTASIPSPTTPSSPRQNQNPRRLSGLPRASTPVENGTTKQQNRLSLRPMSMVSPRTSLGHEDETSGAPFTLTTSKFHFVDLAGSERLKRTGAAGGRVKEGISINSGLLALGNVISALGDLTHATTTTSTHIPYRDSKLTRLLQDSLGGNARTMMIACVSPIEFNLNETLSTIKYANRARNIKNVISTNEVEAGWSEVEYLQKTVIRLRAELATTSSSPTSRDGGSMLNGMANGNGNTNGVKKMGLVMEEFGAAPSVDHSAVVRSGITRDEFALAVEPIVEEYEKSLSALDGQLALTRASLAFSEEEMKELELRVEEEEATNDANALLIEELKSRIGRLTEREATSEGYVRNLESRLSHVDDDEKEETVVLAKPDNREARVLALEVSLAELKSKYDDSELEVAKLRQLAAAESEKQATENEELQSQIRTLELASFRLPATAAPLNLSTVDEFTVPLPPSRNTTPPPASPSTALRSSFIDSASISASPTPRSPIMRRSIPVVAAGTSFLRGGQGGARSSQHFRSPSLSSESWPASTTPPPPSSSSLSDEQAWMREIARLQALLREREDENGTATTTTKEGVDSSRSSVTSDEVRSLAKETGTVGGGGGTESERLNDLMRSMAKKESQHREVVERLSVELATLQKTYQEAVQVSKDQVSNTSNEMERLQLQLASLPGALEFETQLRALTGKHEEERSALLESHRVELELAESSLKEAEENRTRERQELVESHTLALATLSTEHDDLLARQTSIHSTAVDTLSSQHRSAIDDLAAQNAAHVSEVVAASERIADLTVQHALAIADHTTQHEAKLVHLNHQHETRLAELTSQHIDSIHALREEHTSVIASTTSMHDEEVDRMHKEHQSHLESTRHDLVEEHDLAIAAFAEEHSKAIDVYREAIESVQLKLEEKIAENESLSATHASISAQQDELIQRVMELSARHVEAKSTVVELQQERERLLTQLAVRAYTPETKDTSEEITPEVRRYRTSISELDAQIRGIATVDEHLTAVAPGSPSRSISPAMRAGKPPAPPPTGPPPSLPRSASFSNSTLHRSSAASVISRTNSISNGSDSGLMLGTRASKRFEDQEAQMSRLVKQLAHCEVDLKAHVELVNTLEVALNDSERTLRKARNQMTDLSKERDSISVENEMLRKQIIESEMEAKAQEERAVKDRARLELERRLEGASRTKKSKFNCF